MEKGDLVIVRLYGREHEEPATVIKRRNFKDGEQAAIQILWKGRLKWVHNSKLRPLNNLESEDTISYGEGGPTQEVEQTSWMGWQSHVLPGDRREDRHGR